MKREFAQGVSIAAAVAALLSAGSALAQTTGKPKAAEKTVHCGGINACKGQGACNGAKNSCKGQNACKGQGWVETKNAKECKTKWGTIVQ
jgi:uncharacterized membrane protein